MATTPKLSSSARMAARLSTPSPETGSPSKKAPVSSAILRRSPVLEKTASEHKRSFIHKSPGARPTAVRAIDFDLPRSEPQASSSNPVEKPHPSQSTKPGSKSRMSLLLLGLTVTFAAPFLIGQSGGMPWKWSSSQLAGRGRRTLPSGQEFKPSAGVGRAVSTHSHFEPAIGDNNNKTAAEQMPSNNSCLQPPPPGPYTWLLEHDGQRWTELSPDERVQVHARTMNGLHTALQASQISPADYVQQLQQLNTLLFASDPPTVPGPSSIAKQSLLGRMFAPAVIARRDLVSQLGSARVGKVPIQVVSSRRVVEHLGDHLRIIERNLTLTELVGNFAEIHSAFSRQLPDPTAQHRDRRRPLVQYLAAIPGAGKSTVLLESRRLLAEALSSGQLNAHLSEPVFKERFAGMIQHGLVFYQEFRADGTDGPALLENHWQLANSSRLALRMLYAAVQGSKEAPDYTTLLHRLADVAGISFLQALRPVDVTAFLFEAAGIRPGEKAMAAFLWDEVSYAEGYVRTLMGEYVNQLFPGQLVPDPTRDLFPDHFVAMVLASTRVEGGGTAKVVETKAVPVWLLSEDGVFNAALDLLERTFEQPFGSPHDIPRHVRHTLQLAGGNPRLVETALISMSGSTGDDFDLDGFMSFWKSRGERMGEVLHRFVYRGILSQQRLQKYFQSESAASSVLARVAAEAIADRWVTRGALVTGLPAQFGAVTWGELEHAGLLSLAKPGRQMVTPSAATALVLPLDSPHHVGLRIYMSPLMLYCLQVYAGALPTDVYNQLNYPDFQMKEERDVGMLVLKLWALKQTGASHATLCDLFGSHNLNPLCRYRSLPLRIPSDNFHVKTINQILKDGDLERMVAEARMGGPWAFRGAGNEVGPDGWAVLFDDQDEALVIHTQSKLSKGLGNSHASEGSVKSATLSVNDVLTDLKKVSDRPGRWKPSPRSVFAFVTDLRATDDSYKTLGAMADVILIDARRHEAFYGYEGSLMRTFQAVARLARDFRTFDSPPPPPPPPFPSSNSGT